MAWRRVTFLQLFKTRMQNSIFGVLYYMRLGTYVRDGRPLNIPVSFLDRLLKDPNLRRGK